MQGTCSREQVPKPSCLPHLPPRLSSIRDSIKRDIAHLCQDSEPVKRSSSSSNNNNQADTTQEGQQSQAESQTSPGAATSGDTSTFSQHQHQPQSPSQASPEIKLHRASASSSEPPANGTQAQEPTSPLFTASKGELVDTATSSSNAAAPYSTTDNPSDPSPPPMLHRASSHSSYQQSPVYHNQNTQALPPPNTSLPSFTNEITQTPTTAAQRLSTGQAYGNASESSSSNNNSNTNNNPAANGSGSGSNAQNTSSNQQQQQPFNPFTLLNQAYDYSYPSHASEWQSVQRPRALVLVHSQESIPTAFESGVLVSSWNGRSGGSVADKLSCCAPLQTRATPWLLSASLPRQLMHNTATLAKAASTLGRARISTVGMAQDPTQGRTRTLTVRHSSKQISECSARSRAARTARADHLLPPSLSPSRPLPARPLQRLPQDPR